eukprot:Hpha_TRINITY_DN16389_c1_g7::TRINITY_DN16389_c1_g7_i1::g.60073::m.60073/K09489/HSPA4; heat shock 70kDa protein 4
MAVFGRSVVAIDLGSQLCKVALADPQRRMPSIVRNNLTTEVTPCAVAFDDTGRRYVGENAATKATSRPKLTCNLLPTLLRSEGAPKEEVLYKVEGGKAQLPGVGDYTPPQLIGMMVGSLLQDARRSAGAPADAVPGRLVITLPEGSSDHAVRDAAAAGVVAGVPFDRVQIRTAGEAIAAGFRAMRLGDVPAEEEAALKVAIVDVGHCNVTSVVAKVWKGGVEVIAAEGRPVGSRVMDFALTQKVLAHLKQKHKEDLTGNVRVVARLLKEAQRGKEVLSTNAHHELRMEALTDTIDLKYPVTLEELEAMGAPLIEAITEAVTGTIDRAAAAGVKKEDLASVEVIGGGFRLPFVRSKLQNLWGVGQLAVHLDPVQTVAQGAALLGVRADKVEAPKPAEGEGEEKKAEEKAEDKAEEKKEEKAEEKKEEKAAHKDPHAEEEEEGRDIAHVYLFRGTEQKAAATDADELKRMLEVETQLAAEDAAHRRREDAYNALESYFLGRKETGQRAGLDEGAMSGIAKLVEEAESWLIDNEEGSAEEFEAKLKELKTTVEADFPQIAAWEEEERKKAEERDKKLALERSMQVKEPKTDGQRLKAADDRKAQGVVLFKQEHWQEATHRFVQALQYLKEVYDTENPDIKKKRNELSLSCHLNIASCSIKLKRWQHAAQNCSSALEFEPQSAKALFRRGQAKRHQNEFDEAKADLEKANELAGGDKAITKEIALLQAQVDAYKKQEKKRGAAMMKGLFS